MKEKCCQGEKGVTRIPQYLGYRGAIRAPQVKARKDAQHNVCQTRNSNGNIDSDGHRLVDRMKGYHEATQK